MVVGQETLVSPCVTRDQLLAFVSTIMYTISTTISHASHARNADNLGPGIPPESLPVSPGLPSQQHPFCNSAPHETGSTYHSARTPKNTETAESRTGQRSPKSRDANGKRRLPHDGPAEETPRSRTFTLQWSPETQGHLSKFSTTLAQRIVAKMEWFVRQENPLSFAKRLAGMSAPRWRFRIGNYRASPEAMNVLY